MSGWIKIEKDLPQSIRFQRVVRKLRASNTSNALLDVTRCDVALLQSVTLGALARLWFYADSHIDDDNTLEATADEIDAMVGVPGFAASLPREWLIVLPDGRVQLPEFVDKNGNSAKRREDNARRQSEFRARQKTAKEATKSRRVTRDVTLRNASRPDQIRPDQKRREEGEESSAPVGEILARNEGKLTEVKQLATTALVDSAPFERAIMAKFPGGPNPPNWLMAIRNAADLVKDGLRTWPELVEDTERYASFVRAGGNGGTNIAAHNFFDRRKGTHWAQPWDAQPIAPTNGAARKTNFDDNMAELDKYIAAAQEPST